MAMAVQVTIKLTKKDDKDWVFNLPEYADLVHEIELQKDWLASEWSISSPREAVLIKQFPDIFEANKFIIKNIDTDYPAYEAAKSMIQYHDDWREHVTTEEI